MRQKIAILALLLTSCGPTQTYNRLEIAAVSEDAAFVNVQVKTDLPDGSNIHVTLNPGNQSPEELYIGSDMDVAVKNGEASAKLAIPARKEFDTGPYDIELMVTPKKQSKSVLRAIGENGENLTQGRQDHLPFKTWEVSKTLQKLQYP